MIRFFVFMEVSKFTLTFISFLNCNAVINSFRYNVLIHLRYNFFTLDIHIKIIINNLHLLSNNQLIFIIFVSLHCFLLSFSYTMMCSTLKNAEFYPYNWFSFFHSKSFLVWFCSLSFVLILLGM